MAIIRKAQAADADAILALATRFATSFSVHQPAFQSSFASLLNDNTAFLNVAEAAGEVVGYVLGFVHETFFAGGRVAWVEEIMVAERFRSQGIGKALMDNFEAWALCGGCKLVPSALRCIRLPRTIERWDPEPE